VAHTQKTDGMSSTIENKVVTNYEYVTKKDMLKNIYFRCYIEVKTV